MSKSRRKRRSQVTAEQVATSGPVAVAGVSPVAAEAAASPSAAAVPWYRTSLSLAAVGGLLLWVAFPPLNLWPLAWVAPVPWLGLVRMRRLPGRRPYTMIYLVGFLHWLVLLQGLRLAHWATHIGWVALAVYLGVYLPVFIGLSRIAVHRLRVPLLIAAPAVWTGLEYARGYVMTGFSMVLLGHTQAGWLTLIQVSDLAGAYAVSFLVIFVAACLARMWPPASAASRIAWWPLAPAAGVLVAVLAYGAVRIASPTSDDPTNKPVRVALIQESIDTKFDDDPSRPREIFLRYLRLSQRAVAEHPDLDLIVWPESVFGTPTIKFDEDFHVPPAAQESFDRYCKEKQRNFEDAALTLAYRLATPAIIGTDAGEYGRNGLRIYNAALCIDRKGKVVGRYDKMHAVVFGEYVPLGDVFPWLYRLTPMSGGLSEGSTPQVFTVAGLRWCPCICFENTVPHLVRRQIVELTREGKDPDVLVTLTNDGWFWGSSMLDFHFACGLFRAVEHRKPMLIAANTGFSGWIDGNGRVRAKGPRRAPGIVLAEVRVDPRRSLYTRWGDWPAAICLLFCLTVVVAEGYVRIRRRVNRA